jgi:hypothetical protein
MHFAVGTVMFTKEGPFVGGRVPQTKIFPWVFCGDMTENEWPIWTCAAPALPCKKMPLLLQFLGTQDVLHMGVSEEEDVNLTKATNNIS